MTYQRYQSVTSAELAMVEQLFYTERPLSGYVAGQRRGGFYARMLEEEWATAFHVKHAIACNSATSGLLAAAFAIDLQPNEKFVVSPMTMSATAAAPMFTGAKPIFVDVEDEMFSIPDNDLPYDASVFVTNLFGGTGWLSSLRKWCDLNGTYLIEDNSQAPFATEHGKYAGTIGHIGVFSLNIHKPLQCGEGGIIVTDDDDLADALRDFINHGENMDGSIGLNLRMPEMCAAVAVIQLRRAHSIIDERICQAEALLAAIGDIPGLRPPVVREGCTHVYYTVPFLITPGKRMAFCEELWREHVPHVGRYVPPLYWLRAFAEYKTDCPVAERLHNHEMFYIENCAWTFTGPQIKLIGDAFKRAAEKVLT